MVLGTITPSKPRVNNTRADQDGLSCNPVPGFVAWLSWSVKKW